MNKATVKIERGLLFHQIWFMGLPSSKLQDISALKVAALNPSGSPANYGNPVHRTRKRCTLCAADSKNVVPTAT